VALRYIGDGLSAALDDGEWVLTSYLAANAVLEEAWARVSARIARGPLPPGLSEHRNALLFACRVCSSQNSWAPKSASVSSRSPMMPARAIRTALVSQ
jgi:hypothetical protein